MTASATNKKPIILHGSSEESSAMASRLHLSPFNGSAPGGVAMRRIASEEWGGKNGAATIVGSSISSSSTSSSSKSNTMPKVATPPLRSTTGAIVNGGASRSPPSAHRFVVPRSREPGSEILQDGLGSDELIPSAWATGSSAQFASPSSSSLNSPAAAARQGPHAAMSTTPPHYAGLSGEWQNIDFSSSPTLSATQQQQQRGVAIQRSTPSLSVAADSHTGFSLEQARERARRLAREREAGLAELAERRASGTEEHDKQQQQQTNAGEMDGIASSSAAAANVNGTASAPGANSSLGQASGSTAGPALHNAKRQNGNAQARRAPTQGSQNGRAHGAKVAQSYAPRSKSANMSSTRTKATGQAATPQHILDEFGPLGGSVQGKGNNTWATGGDTDEFGSSRRVVSNPWDEEYIPTVKRRMEQERLLGQVSQSIDSDVLYDTWDRNGLPLRESHLDVARQQERPQGSNEQGDRAGEDAAAKAQTDTSHAASLSKDALLRKERGGTEQAGQYSKSSDQEASHIDGESSTDAERSEAEDRMRRLTSALDAGLQTPPKSILQKSEQKVEKRASPSRGTASAAPAKEEQDTIVKRDGKLQIHRAQSGRTATPSSKTEKPFSSPVDNTTKTENATTPKTDTQQEKGPKPVEDEAGCCKCVVM